MALIFCRACNEPIAATESHGVLTAWEYAGLGYCRKHPAPAGQVETQPGFCEYRGRMSRGHNAPAVWYVPVFAGNYCRQHLATIVTDAIRRGSFGQ